MQNKTPFLSEKRHKIESFFLNIQKKQLLLQRQEGDAACISPVKNIIRE